MNNLKTALYNLISPETPLYEEVAPEGTSMPYATYTFGPSVDEYDREDFQLIIDLWDNKPNDTTDIDNLNQTIKNLLDNHTQTDANVGFTLYLTGRLNIADPEPTIRRRQLTFRCTTYFA